MSDAFRFLDRQAEMFSTGCARFFDSLIRGLEILPDLTIHRAIKAITRPCLLCAHVHWRWEKNYPCLRHFKDAPRYPEYLWVEVWGMRDYEALYPPSEADRAMLAFAKAMQSTGISLPKKEPSKELYRYK
jgi:hypothetical protein